MPTHDWTLVSAGAVHAFHDVWITHIQEALNRGLLPGLYYAVGEQRVRECGPDFLAVKADDAATAADELSGVDPETVDPGGMVAIAQSPPKVRISQETDKDVFDYLQRQRAVVIRRRSGDRVVAVIEIVSPANRNSLTALGEFADKVIHSLRNGVHVVVIDPFPDGRHAPDGIHGFIWDRMLAGEYRAPVGQPLTLVSYCVGQRITAWIEPLATGAELTSMPLFLTSAHYLALPLEETYQQSWAGVPQQWKRVILGDETAETS